VRAHVPPDEPQERTVHPETNKPVAARMNTHGRHFLITMVAPLRTCFEAAKASQVTRWTPVRWRTCSRRARSVYLDSITLTASCA
jgi:hypothetical protein